MKRVLITGITGYIGSHLARALLPNHEIYGLVRSPVRSEYITDIQDRIHLLHYDGSYESVEYGLKNAKPEIVFHLAACCIVGNIKENTSNLIASNITFGGYLLTAMAVTGIQNLVYASTFWEHYENQEYCPLNLYAATKHAFSDLVTYYTEEKMVKAVRLVLSDTYGPNDHRPKILNLVKQAAQNGEQLELSDGQQDYDAVYIDDVVRAFQQAGEWLQRKPEWKNEIFQVCSPEPLSLRETVNQMLFANQLTLNAVWEKRPDREREIRKAIRLYPTLPGWTVQVPLEEGLKKIWES